MIGQLAQVCNAIDSLFRKKVLFVMASSRIEFAWE